MNKHSTPSPVAVLPGQHHTIALDGPDEGVRLGYWDWGNPAAQRTIVCVHGLTRNARDFDWLARALSAKDARVLAIDVAGRGTSSWLPDPQHYTLPTYARQISRTLDLLVLPQVEWIGTSMGGWIGIVVASADPDRVTKLVLNDIGPFVTNDALTPITTYLGIDRTFADLYELEQHLRYIYAGFGRLTDAQWQHLAMHSARNTAEGLSLHYDPAIRLPFIDSVAADVNLWREWDSLRCPTLVLRGEHSQLLTVDTLIEMQRRRPEIDVVTWADVGHAPALMAAEQIETLQQWLNAVDA